MSADLEFELRQFNSVADLVAEESSRAGTDFINGQGLAVASRAIKHTVKANADRIAYILGQIATATHKVSTKTGKLIKDRSHTAILREDSFAGRIVNARLRKLGQPMLWGDALEQAARNEINRRKKSTGFIASGWIWAIKKLSKAVGYAPNDYKSASARARGKAKGDAVPAKYNVFGGDSVCAIGNSALLEAGQFSRGGNPMPIAEAGLAAALDETSTDMLDHFNAKLKPIFDAHSA